MVETAFLNVFPDLFHVNWEPLPPEVEYLTSIAFANVVVERKTALLTQAVFRVTGEPIAGTIAVAVPLPPNANA